MSITAATPHLTQKLRVLAQGSNITVLDEEAIVVGGVRFLGATLWTDYALFGIDRRADCEHHARTKMTDHQRIRVSPAFSKLTPAAAHGLHRRARTWLAGQLATPHDGATVVVTHHAPTARSLPPQFAADLLSAAYASNLEHLLTGAADLWVLRRRLRRWRNAGRVEPTRIPRRARRRVPAGIHRRGPVAVALSVCIDTAAGASVDGRARTDGR